MAINHENNFEELSLSKEIIQAIKAVGYERPSPIQSLTIPYILKGRDVLGQAQTGTGKTAAFALPLLNNLDLKQKDPQVLVLAPTRELAIQVAEAFQKYASKLKQFYVQPIYGGQDYTVQLRSLKRGVHVVVGTPGRVMDHIKRGTLKLDNLKTLVLDEADEMLRMGFIDDVKWVLERLPEKKQIALFSATMPTVIQRIAKKYLVNPEVIRIESKSSTADTVEQRYWMVKKIHKLDALTRILEAEAFEGAIVFVRTKSATIELAEKLKARGFAAAALNGDIVQAQREKTVSLLKKAVLDIVVATDVAARGLDVERVTHVINYDIPFDPESYVHRIGRTGRAGRKGDAILFVSPREQRMLRTIERSTKNTITRMELPSKKDIEKKRREEFKKKLTAAINADDLAPYFELVEEYIHENEISLEKVAAALAKLSQGDRSLEVKDSEKLDKYESTSERSPRQRKDGKARSTRRSTSRSDERKPRRKDKKSESFTDKSSKKSYKKDAEDKKIRKSKPKVNPTDRDSSSKTKSRADKSASSKTKSRTVDKNKSTKTKNKSKIKTDKPKTSKKSKGKTRKSKTRSN